MTKVDTNRLSTEKYTDFRKIIIHFLCSKTSIITIRLSIRIHFVLQRLYTVYLHYTITSKTQQIWVFFVIFHTDYIQILYKFSTDYLQIIYRLSTGYLQIIYRLSRDYLQVTYRLTTAYLQKNYRFFIQIIYILYKNSTQIIYRLYTCFIYYTIDYFGTKIHLFLI